MRNETVKTFTFVILAVILAALVYFCRPVVTEFKSEEMVGKQLFPKFTNPLVVKTLEIVKTDSSGTPENFKIAEVGGVWSIPSHENYPADAKDQMAKTAEALTGLTVLDVVTHDDGDTAALQAMYGVVDPSASGTSTAADGVGMKITLVGENNEQLVNVIIGKKVETKADDSAMSGANGNGLHYVRIPDQQPIYVIAVDTSRFPTDFDHWIEKNLLDISTLDTKQIFIDEYSFKIEVGLSQDGLQETLAPEFKGDITLDYNGTETGAAKWKLAQWMEFKGRDFQYQERKLDANQVLDTDTLDAAVSALNDLKIVSVLRKPAVLAKSLRDGQPFEKIKMDSSMKKTGFYLVTIPDLKGDKTKTKLQLLSNEGDIQLRMKDGIRYNLRFGDLTGTESAIEDGAGKTDAVQVPEKEKTLGANRYLFITAEFDSSAIPVAEAKPVPEIPADAKPEDVEKLTQEKEAVEKSNQREAERYKADVESGQKRAEKLSSRFADWYYVIPEDVYKKIHLTQANIFKRAESPVESEQPAEAAPAGNNLPDLPGVQ